MKNKNIRRIQGILLLLLLVKLYKNGVDCVAEQIFQTS